MVARALFALLLLCTRAAFATSEDTETAPASLEAAFGDGVTIRSGDDLFRVNLRARIQAQVNSSFPAPGGPDSFRADQALIRRARLAIRATFLHDWELYLQLGTSTLDVDPEAPTILRDAALSWRGLRDLSVRFGQMKIPFDRQRLTSSSALQMVDRSLVVAELNVDRDVGIQLFSDDLAGLGEKLYYAVGVFGGDGRNRAGTRPGLMYVAKVAYRPFGKLEDAEADFARESSPKLALSLAGARNINTSRERSTIGPVYEIATFDYWHGVAEAQLRWHGLSVLTEALVRKADRASITEESTGLTEDSRSVWGYFAQSGFLFAEHWEAVVRFGELYPVKDLPGPRHTREMGLGLNWYFMHNDLKVQADYHYISFPDGPPGKHLARLQAQMYF